MVLDARPHPNPLPEEGESFAALLKCRSAGLAGWFLANQKSADSCSFSLGEKAGMRAGVKTNFHGSGVQEKAVI